MKVCSQCEKRVRGLKHLTEFPDDFGWCSYKCMFEWFREHSFKVDGEPVEKISNKKGIFYAQDY